MELKIIKRNGDLVDFDKQKIINAVNKAFIEVDKTLYETETAESIAADIERLLVLKTQFHKVYSVEEIQDLVEELLMSSERKDVARAYVRYRYKREAARNNYDDFIKEFSDKIYAKDIENQNANVDEISFGGRVGASSDLSLKKFALEYCMSNMARKNHENNEIYIHDLNAYPVGMHNCLSVPLDDLLTNGFNTRQTDVRPAGSVSTAMQLVAVIF